MGSSATPVLVAFAVKEEAAPFRRLTAGMSAVHTCVLGMGPANARRSAESALAQTNPALALTCGFAGGLDPGLKTGTIIYSGDVGGELEKKLRAAGARPVQFLGVDRIATTAAGKQQLRESTGADAVEMESFVVAAICRERKIPCVTVRIVLDTADEDLAIDFNQLVTADWRLDARKLAWLILRSPARIGDLLRLQRRSKSAAEKLANVIISALK